MLCGPFPNWRMSPKSRPENVRISCDLVFESCIVPDDDYSVAEVFQLFALALVGFPLFRIVVMRAVHENGRALQSVSVVVEVGFSVNAGLGTELGAIWQSASRSKQNFQEPSLKAGVGIYSFSQPLVLLFVGHSRCRPSGDGLPKLKEEIANQKTVKQTMIGLVRVAQQTPVAGAATFLFFRKIVPGVGIKMA